MLDQHNLEQHVEVSEELAKDLNAILNKLPELDSVLLVLDWGEGEMQPLMGLWRTQDGPAIPQIVNGDIALAEMMESHLQEWISNIRILKEAALKADLENNGLDNVSESKEEPTQAPPKEQTKSWRQKHLEEVEKLGFGLRQDLERYYEEVEGYKPEARTKEDVGGAGKDAERSFTLSDYSFD